MAEENEVIDEKVENQTEETPEQDSDDDIEKASRIGWTPKEHFKGDPEKWVSAKEFLKRGEERLPLVQAELRRTQDRLAAVEKSAKALAEHHRKTEEMAYKRAIEDLKKQRAQAISELDGEMVNKLDDEIDALKQKGVQSGQNSNGSPAHQEAFAQWEANNSWVKGRKGQAIAEALAQEVAEEYPELVGNPAILDKITEKARKEFPQLFPELENPRRAQPSAVISGQPPKAKGKKTISDLPPDARDACRDFVKRGYMSEAQYIKDYFGE
jgi:hypothetical protein